MSLPFLSLIRHDGRRRALTAAFCVLFLTYAGCFLYFFVDDEAIPLVYARNLLRGRGLAYTALEGRVEGYSDFLHVLWSAVLLAVTRVLGLSPVAPLLVGKVVSLAAGAAILAYTARVLDRQGIAVPASIAALAFLALAGPLAVWSASSLETVVCALTVLAFAIACWDEQLTPAVLLGILLVLERIDGPVYVIAVIAAGLMARPSRWRSLARVAVLTGSVGVAFHAWRWAYFGELLSAPLAAKVLYRLHEPPHAVIKEADVSYFAGLAGIYGWTGLALMAAAAMAAVRSPIGRASIGVLLCLGVYADRVGDWMFGWRFAVAMTPFAAIVLALAVDRVPRRGRAIVAAGICLWSAVAARAFLQTYVRDERRPIFWLSPHGGEAAWFGRYHELLEQARQLVRPGDRIADNQAGLIPYLLDAENIDDLGICSTFVARLPTTDVYYTGVGRYSPLTNQPIVRTAHAYLLHRDVRVIITPQDLLVKANYGRVPELLIDGLYRRVDLPLSQNQIYVRTDKPAREFTRDPSTFTENLAHVSHVIRASVDGTALPDAEIERQLPFLRELPGNEIFRDTREMALTFARHDEAVTMFYAGVVALRGSGTLTVSLISETGAVVFRRDVPVGSSPGSVFLPLSGTRASTLVLSVRASGDERFTLADVRLLGQTAALRDYVQRSLRFREP
jgi:hypothetical protein